MYIVNLIVQKIVQKKNTHFNKNNHLLTTNLEEVKKNCFYYALQIK